MTNSLYWNILAAIILLGLVMPALVWAHGAQSHNSGAINNTVNIDNSTTIRNSAINENATATRISSGSDSRDIAQATATAIATGCPWYYGTHKLQGCVTGAYYDGKSAVNIGLGWRPKDTEILFFGEIVPDHDPDKTAYKAGGILLF